MNKVVVIGFVLVAMIVAIGGLAYSGYLGRLVFPRAATSSVAAVSNAPRTAAPSGACATDTMLCANGSIVGRVAPSCNFAACPGGGVPVPNASPGSGSGSSNSASGSSGGAASGSLFSARIGESATFSGATVTLVSLAEDSRCPLGAQCIQAGTVRVNVKIQKGLFTTTQVFTLNQPVSFAGITGELVSVSPDKRTGETIPLSAYQFTFRVSGL